MCNYIVLIKTNLYLQWVPLNGIPDNGINAINLGSFSQIPFSKAGKER
jgi:hypothetical protein